MTARSVPAFVIVPGTVVVLDGRGAKIFGARWTENGRRRRRRLFFHDADGKPRFEDFGPSDWLDVISVPSR